MLRFKGVEIPCTHGQVVIMPPELMAQRRYFWGLDGVGEIIGGTGMRVLTVDAWIHKNYTFSALQTYLEDLDGTVGQSGTLRCTLPGGVSQTFQFCTFDGFFRESLPGQGPVMLQDIAGTVDDQAGHWFAAGQLRWTQLQV